MLCIEFTNLKMQLAKFTTSFFVYGEGVHKVYKYLGHFVLESKGRILPRRSRVTSGKDSTRARLR